MTIAFELAGQIEQRLQLGDLVVDVHARGHVGLDLRAILGGQRDGLGRDPARPVAVDEGHGIGPAAEDGGSAPDTGGDVDAGAGSDAGAATDAATGTDVSVLTDAGSTSDASTAIDAISATSKGCIVAACP